MKNIIVIGAGGFIGSHLVEKLKQEGNWVLGLDLKYPEFSETEADYFIKGDARDYPTLEKAFNGHPERIFKENHFETAPFDEVYQLGAMMGGAGYIFTGEHDADVMSNSAAINIAVAQMAVKYKAKKLFYSSSACIYPAYNQTDPLNPKCSEESAYPAQCDSPYGWEKLFSENLYMSFARNYGLNVRIARFHNIYGPMSAWQGGREKSPAALCRKVAECPDGGEIEVWGSGEQTRSFLYIEECLEGVERLMNSEHAQPINIGSEERISINDFAKMIIGISGKSIRIKNIDVKQIGVMGRNSDNTLIRKVLGWAPSQPLIDGITKTYSWIQTQVENSKKA